MAQVGGISQKLLWLAADNGTGQSGAADCRAWSSGRETLGCLPFLPSHMRTLTMPTILWRNDAHDIYLMHCFLVVIQRHCFAVSSDRTVNHPTGPSPFIHLRTRQGNPYEALEPYSLDSWASYQSRGTGCCFHLDFPGLIECLLQIPTATTLEILHTLK